MPLVKGAPFQNEGGKKQDTPTVRLNPKERRMLEEDKRLLGEWKDGTALKTIWKLGHDVAHSPQYSRFIKILMKNKDRNEGYGLQNPGEFE